MKGLKYFLLIVFSVSLVSLAYMQTYNPEKKFPVKQLQKDFIELRKLIEDNHPALYRYYDEAFLKNYFNSVYSLINREMTELEFIKILEPMVAKVHCGHTELWYSKNFQDYIYANGLFIPFSIHYIDNSGTVHQTDFPVLEGSYLGQKPPGLEPELFAPGIISTNGSEFCITFSRDGRECYFQRGREIFVTMERNGLWTPPEIAPFSGKYPDGDPFLSPDDQKLFFTSERPVNKKKSKKSDTDIWYVKRDDQKWSEPYHLGNQINTDLNERTPTVASDGTLYFHVFDGENPCDLYYSNYENEKYSSPRPVAGLNTDTESEADAFISPNKDYILFLQNGISISFSDKNGDWKTPVCLNNLLGSKYENTWPRISFDGKYLFFSSFRPDPNNPEHRSPSIYWVDAKIIEAFRPRTPLDGRGGGVIACCYQPVTGSNTKKEIYSINAYVSDK